MTRAAPRTILSEKNLKVKSHTRTRSHSRLRILSSLLQNTAKLLFVTIIYH